MQTPQLAQVDLQLNACVHGPDACAARFPSPQPGRQATKIGDGCPMALPAGKCCKAVCLARHISQKRQSPLTSNCPLGMKAEKEDKTFLGKCSLENFLIIKSLAFIGKKSSCAQGNCRTYSSGLRIIAQMFRRDLAFLSNYPSQGPGVGRCCHGCKYEKQSCHFFSASQSLRTVTKQIIVN